MELLTTTLFIALLTTASTRPVSSWQTCIWISVIICLFLPDRIFHNLMHSTPISILYCCKTAVFLFTNTHRFYLRHSGRCFILRFKLWDNLSGNFPLLSSVWVTHAHWSLAYSTRLTLHILFYWHRGFILWEMLNYWMWCYLWKNTVYFDSWIILEFCIFHSIPFSLFWLLDLFFYVIKKIGEKSILFASNNTKTEVIFSLWN